MRPLNLGVPVILASILVSTAVVGCKRPADKQEQAAAVADVAEVLPVRFAKLTERTLPPTLEASGTLAPDESSEVAAPGPGIVTSVEVDVGSRVKKGDTLVRLDGRDASLRLAQANAASAQAQARLGLKSGDKFDPQAVADVRAAKEAMDFAVTDAQRTKSLFDSGGVAQAQWDQARSRAEQAKAQYDAAINGAQQSWAGLSSAQASANLAQKSLSDTLIRAPFDGSVAERRINAGEYAQIGKVVVVVVRDNPLRFRIDIPEADAGKIAEGKDVSLTVSAYPGRVFHGAIKRIGATVKAQSRTLPIEAEVPNAEGTLKPGSFARAAISLGGADEKTLFAPRAAIGNSGSASRIFVRVGSRVIERIVTLGREADGMVEIRGTLTSSDEVAVENVDKLSDGAEVKPLL